MEYRESHRRLQERYDTRRLADRLAEVAGDSVTAFRDFIDFQTGSRLRLSGEASIDPDDPLTGTFPGALFVVRVRARAVFPNCRRYVHTHGGAERSVFVPHADAPARGAGLEAGSVVRGHPPRRRPGARSRPPERSVDPGVLSPSPGGALCEVQRWRCTSTPGSSSNASESAVTTWRPVARAVAAMIRSCAPRGLPDRRSWASRSAWTPATPRS